MDISEEGIKFLERLEGVRKFPYPDSKGLLTIGVGHLLTEAELDTKLIIIGTESVKWSAGLTDDQADVLFKQDISPIVNALNRALGKFPLRQSQFDALVSVTFNIGIGNMRASTFISDIKSNKIVDVPRAIMLWNKPSEIRGRRTKEAMLFSTGIYS